MAVNQPDNRIQPLFFREVADEVPSTNDRLKSIYQERPLQHGSWVAARHQTSGRGQRGAGWYDVPGQSVLLSVLLKPESLVHEQVFSLNVTICLKLKQLLSPYGLPLSFKWPNDLVVGERKIGGILIENFWLGSRLQAVVVGLGLNVSEPDFPRNLPQATSWLLETGSPPPVDELREVVAHGLAALEPLRPWPELKEAYTKELLGWQEWRWFLSEGKRFEARPSDLLTDGRLGLTHRNGNLVYYDLKEISWELGPR